MLACANLKCIHNKGKAVRVCRNDKCGWMFQERLYCKKCFMSECNALEEKEDEKKMKEKKEAVEKGEDKKEEDHDLDITVTEFEKMGYRLNKNHVEGYEEYGEINDFFQQIEANERERDDLKERQRAGVIDY